MFTASSPGHMFCILPVMTFAVPTVTHLSVSAVHTLSTGTVPGQPVCSAVNPYPHTQSLNHLREEAQSGGRVVNIHRHEKRKIAFLAKEGERSSAGTEPL